MAERAPEPERRTLGYSGHPPRLKDWLRFIQLGPFQRAWERLELADDDLRALEVAIMADPKRADVVPGTGGLRKVRFAPARWHTGTRGAARVGYFYLEEFGIVFLLAAYAKGDKDDLTPDDRRAVRGLIEEVFQHCHRTETPRDRSAQKRKDRR